MQNTYMHIFQSILGLILIYATVNHEMLIMLEREDFQKLWRDWRRILSSSTFKWIWGVISALDT